MTRHERATRRVGQVHPETMRIFGFAGWSGSGKTTLIEQLIPRLVARVGAVSLVKHAHHAFDVDQPGKDSWRHRNAGCAEVLVTSDSRWALMHELRGTRELSLHAAISRLSPCALVLVEGWKAAPIPRLEVWRKSMGKPLLHPSDPGILGVATDVPANVTGGLRPIFELTAIDEIATFVDGHAAWWPLAIDLEPVRG